MTIQVDHQFEQILSAAKERRGDNTVDSMIVSSHLSQMRMFILRRGVEFYCPQDSYGYRKEFIRSVCEHNMLEMKFDSIVDYFLCDGQGLFYFRPSGENYQLLYFPKDNYRAYRDENGELDNIVLIYSFNVHEPLGLDAYATQDSRGGKKKYIRLAVYKDRIDQTISNEKIEFDNHLSGQSLQMGGQTETLTNSLGFIPAVEVFNHMDCTGEAAGNGEFDWLSNHILYHDELVKNVRKNLKFFGNPTLLSSRPKHDIIESGDDNTFRPTISSQAGFAAIGRSSTRVSEPFGGASALDGQIRVPRVIANLEPTDRVNYLTPDSVSGDQNMYIKNYRSEIRLALGGVDDIDIGTASTAYEMKSLYGRVAATAEKKAKALFTYGLCKLFELIVKHEENLFKDSFAAAINLQKPEVPLPEEFPSKEAYEQVYSTYLETLATYTMTLDQAISATLEIGEMPPGVTGLIPDGSIKVSWRWMGEVFEDSSDDILQHSIVVRNLQEAGVGSIEALKYLFPNKTEEERASMLTGFPFRVVRETQQSLNTFIGLLGNLYSLPHPQTPDMPLASDPNLDITGFLYRSLEYLRKELSYSGTYKPSTDDSSISTLSYADKRRAELGRPVRDERPPDIAGLSTTYSNSGPTGGSPNSLNPASFGASSSNQSRQPMAGGVSGPDRKPERQQPIPGPGVTVGLPTDANTPGQYPGAMGFANTSTAGPSSIFGSPDLLSPSFNPTAGTAAPGSATPAASGTTTTTARRRQPTRRQSQRSVSKPNNQRKSRSS